MIRTTIFLVVVLTSFAAASAQAAVINVQLGSLNPAESPLYIGTAAAPDNGVVWNKLTSPTGTTGTLLDSQGGGTGVTFTIGSTSSILFNDTVIDNGFPADFSNTGAPNLMRGQAAANGAAVITILLSGLNPGLHYSLYAYSDRSGSGTTPFTNQTSVTVYDNTNPLLPGTTVLNTSNGGSTTVTGINSASTAGFHTPEDYVLFTGLVPTTITSSGQIEIQYVGTAANYGALNGFQLVETPEPSSLILFGLGTIAMFQVVRRRRSA